MHHPQRKQKPLRSRTVLSLCTLVLLGATAGPAQAFFGFACDISGLIDVKGLRAERTSPGGIGLYWDKPLLPPLDIFIGLHTPDRGSFDATPSAPQWMWLHPERTMSSGFSTAVHGIVPGPEYVGEVCLKNECGDWECDSVAFTLPHEPGFDENDSEQAAIVADAAEQGYTLAQNNQREDTFTEECLECDPDFIAPQHNTLTPEIDHAVEGVRNFERLYSNDDTRRFSSIVFDGTHTLITTTDGREVFIARNSAGVALETEYDARTGATAFAGELTAGMQVWVNEPQVDTRTGLTTVGRTYLQLERDTHPVAFLHVPDPTTDSTGN